MVTTLSFEEVMAVHDRLTEHFSETADPISPSGLKSPSLLHSAVSRQTTSLGGILKYPEPRLNAASLLFGICMNHPFHNGNKRAALVSTIVHLDKNNYIPSDMSHQQIYDLLLGVADHALPRLDVRISRRVDPTKRFSKWTPDQEVAFIGHWLHAKTRITDKHERPCTFRQLRQLLGRHGVRFGTSKHNFIDIYYVESFEKRLFGVIPLGTRERTMKVQLSYAGENEQLSAKTVKMIRDRCSLTELDGVDSRSFYGDEDRIDMVLNSYRSILKKLART